MLSTALALPHVFELTLSVQTHPRVLDSGCTARPCYTATVTVSVPAADSDCVGDCESAGANAFVYNVSVDQNMRMVTHVRDDAVVAPCL